MKFTWCTNKYVMTSTNHTLRYRKVIVVTRLKPMFLHRRVKCIKSNVESLGPVSSTMIRAKRDSSNSLFKTVATKYVSFLETIFSSCFFLLIPFLLFINVQYGHFRLVRI